MADNFVEYTNNNNTFYNNRKLRKISIDIFEKEKSKKLIVKQGKDKRINDINEINIEIKQ